MIYGGEIGKIGPKNGPYLKIWVLSGLKILLLRPIVGKLSTDNFYLHLHLHQISRIFFGVSDKHRRPIYIAVKERKVISSEILYIAGLS